MASSEPQGKSEPESKKSSGISRRSFIGAAVGTAAVGVVAGYAGGYLTAPKTPSNQVIEIPTTWNQETDVIVVGGGVAGLSASIEAANGGAAVTLLEKQPAVGGATLLSGGLIYASNTVIQQKYGITDTPAAMAAHYTHAARGFADPNQIAVAAQKSADNINFMIGLGASYAEPTVSGAEVLEDQPAVPRVHSTTANNGALTGGAAVIALLKAGAAKAGVNVLTSTPAQSLIARGGNEVLGVQAQSNGGTINIKARKGVILAAGGFQGSKAMQTRYSGKTYYSLPLGPAGLTGDGHLMGLALGADVINMHQNLGVPGLMLPGATSATFILPPEFVPAAVIMVNIKGLRFVDETIYYAHKNEMLLRQETYSVVGPPVVYTVFDQAVVNSIGGGTIVSGFSKDLSAEVNSGIVLQASTIAGLASAMGVDPSGFQATINAWNGYAQSGTDAEFGRTTGMGPVSTSPFYAIPTQSTMFDTSGGLKINTNAQVIDTEGSVIPRLYAAGTNSGGVIGEYYPGSGTALNQGLTFGRIAGAYAASQANWS